MIHKDSGIRQIMNREMKFCTAITCMDGRIQLPVNEFLRKRFNVKYVDTISEAGPILILANNNRAHTIDSILGKLNISVENHKSAGIAVVAHHDCAGNPASDEEQINHIKKSVSFILRKYPDLEVIGLWVDKNWEVQEI